MSLTQIWPVGAAGIAAAALLATGAMAAPPGGKPGLWDITTKMDMGGVAMQMPDMSSMPPEVQARLKSMNIRPSNDGIRTQQCISQADMDRQEPPMPDKTCKILRSSHTGNSYTAEVACKGDFNGTGQMKFVYLSPERFSGVTKMKGVAHGQPMATTINFDGKWLSASCPKVAN